MPESGFAVVAFIDVLGYSSRVLAIKTPAQFLALRRDVRLVQRFFEHRPSDQNTQESHRIISKKVLAFSDCLVISVALRSSISKIQGTLDPILSHLSSLALAQAECVGRGIFLRGGLDIGIWYKERDLLISQALVGAYELERRTNVPVIAVSDKLRQYLENHPHLRHYAESPLPGLLGTRSHPTTNAPLHFVDYLPLTFNEVDGRLRPNERQAYRQTQDPFMKERIRVQALQRDERRWLNDHRRRIRQEARKHSSEQKILEKYVWLAQYHDDFVHELTDDFARLAIGAL